MGKLALLFERQWLHVLALIALLSAIYLLRNIDGMASGEIWSVSTLSWFWLAIWIPIIHQIYVWFCWRTELHYSLLSRILGKAGFPLYAVGFAIIGIFRVVVVFLLAIANQGTLPWNQPEMKIVAIILLIPSLYLFYSVFRYFGARRAFGMDHFDGEFRHKPFVKQGIFKYTNNGMYTFGFLLLWAPAFWYGSVAALVVALFNHLYIWVHYYATEQPDMKRIYNN